eukprot:g12952.t1
MHTCEFDKPSRSSAMPASAQSTTPSSGDEDWAKMDGALRRHQVRRPLRSGVPLNPWPCRGSENRRSLPLLK